MSFIGSEEPAAAAGTTSNLEIVRDAGGWDNDDDVDIGSNSNGNRIPPLSSLLNAVRSTWVFAKWPGAFLLLNGICFTTLLVLYWSYFEDPTENDDVVSKQMIKMFKRNSSVVATLLFLDAICFYKAI